MNLNRQQGMTLLEVLVATGILAVISGMAFLSIDNMVKAKASLSEAITEINQANLAQYQFQTDIQMAVSSQQRIPPPLQPEFQANAQTITLLRYRSAQVPVPRVREQRRQQHIPLMRVRWYIRNDQWYRATQQADSPVNSNQWLEQPMLDLKSLSCEFANQAGLMQSVWPNSPAENSQLPKQILCQLHTSDNQRTVLKLTPWQHVL